MNNKEKNTYVKNQLTITLLNMLKTTSINDISISNLCSNAQIGRASFYRNFNSKEDVIKAYANELIKQWGHEFETNPDSSIVNVFCSLFNHYKRNSDFYTLLCKQNMTDLILDSIINKIGLTPELDNKEAYEKAYLAYGIYGWVIEWIKRGMKESAEEINETFYSKLIQIYPQLENNQ